MVTRNKLILRTESNLIAIGSYVNQFQLRLSFFTVASRYMSIMEERCANSQLDMSRLGGKIDALMVVVILRT